MTSILDLSTSPTLRLLVRLIGRRSPPSTDGRPPTDNELTWLLRAATTVPDHGSLQPWRFVVVSGDARHQLGQALVEDFEEAREEAPPSVIDKVRRKALAAPSLIVLIASPRVESNVPVWEQVASASCCGYAIVLAAHALGLGAVWKSTSYREGTSMRSLCQLSETEQLLGWVTVGGKDDEDNLALHSLPDLSSIASVLSEDGRHPYRASD